MHHPGLGRAARGFPSSVHWGLQTPPMGGGLHLLDVRMFFPKMTGQGRNVRLSQRWATSRTQGKAAARPLHPDLHEHERGSQDRPSLFWPRADARAVPCRLDERLDCSPGPGQGHVWPCSCRKSRRPVPSRRGLCTHRCPRCHSGGLHPSPAPQNTACRFPRHSARRPRSVLP